MSADVTQARGTVDTGVEGPCELSGVLERAGDVVRPRVGSGDEDIGGDSAAVS